MLNRKRITNMKTSSVNWGVKLPRPPVSALSRAAGGMAVHMNRLAQCQGRLSHLPHPASFRALSQHNSQPLHLQYLASEYQPLGFFARVRQAPTLRILLVSLELPFHGKHTSCVLSLL